MSSSTTDISDIFSLFLSFLMVTCIVLILSCPSLASIWTLGYLSISTFFLTIGYTFAVSVICTILGVIYSLGIDSGIGITNIWALFGTEIIIPNPPHSSELNEWCKEHCIGKWEQVLGNKYRFLHKKDAIRFKLTWR
jgi:hypothetical protein